MSVVSRLVSRLGISVSKLYQFLDFLSLLPFKKVQVGKDQEKGQSEKDYHSKNQGGKKPNQQSGTRVIQEVMRTNV